MKWVVFISCVELTSAENIVTIVVYHVVTTFVAGTRATLWHNSTIDTMTSADGNIFSTKSKRTHCPVIELSAHFCHKHYYLKRLLAVKEDYIQMVFQ